MIVFLGLILIVPTLLWSAGAALPDPSAFPLSYKRAETEDQYVRALAYYRADQFAKAADLLTKVVWIDPHDWQAFEYLGHCRYRLDLVSDALEAYDRSLLVQQDNPELSAWVARLGGGSKPVVAALPPVSASTEAAVASTAPVVEAATPAAVVPKRTPIPAPHPFGRGPWARFSAGYGQASLKGLSDGAAAWNRELASLGGVASDSGKGGMVLDFETGFLAHPNHGFSLDLSLMNWKDYHAEFSGLDEEYWVNIDPSTIPIYLQYNFFLPARDMRLSVSAGVGYELAYVNYREINTTQDIDLNFIGGGLSLQAKVTAEWPIGNNWGLQVSASGRSGKVKKLECDYYSDESGSGRATLAVDPDGLIFARDVLSVVGSGSHPLELDLTGFTLTAGITRYIW
jgi:tetratricopeptide (TPR) repeat protein